MIAFVHGMAVDMTESSVVVEAGGIGYEIYMTDRKSTRLNSSHIL